MGELVLKDAKIYFAGYDLGGDMNDLTLTIDTETLDNTVFGSSFRRRFPGLKNVEVSAGGFWNVSTGAGLGTSEGKIDPIAFRNIGGTTEVVTVSRGTALGNEAYFFKGLAGEYSPGGSIGEMFGYNFTAFGAGSIAVKGKVLESGDLSTGLTVTSQNIGTGSTAAKKLYASLHILSVRAAADKINIAIQGASESGFSAPTTMFEFLASELTTGSPGNAYFKSTNLASTKHTHYRAAIYTSAGTTDSSFNGILSAGIE